MAEQEGPRPSDMVRLGDEEATVQVLSQAVLGLWEVVNNLTRLRPTRRGRYRVTIFGSARTDTGHWGYAAVRDLAAGKGFEFRPRESLQAKGFPEPIQAFEVVWQESASPLP